MKKALLNYPISLHYQLQQRSRILALLSLILLCSGLLSGTIWAQTPTPGLIFKAATAGTPGAAVLDPNGDGYVSASSTGFTSAGDVSTLSEIPYRYLPQIVAPREPMADLRVGPNSKFTDFADVPGGGNSVGFYVDGNNNFMFRFRLGGAAPNSKGYSIAIDTDGKFGFSGPDADPNAVVGNPGFEMEILLASNFGVRLYNLDGTANPSDPGLVGGGGPDGSMVEMPFDSYAQKAIAYTTNDGTLDVFYDFYIPLSVIQAEFGPHTFFGTSGTATSFSLSTPLRMVANTIIAPHSVTKYQNISDISGLANVPNADNGFIDLIGGFTPTTGGSLPPGNNIPARTAAPAVNCPVQKGATTISGISTEIGATITVYFNGVAQTTTPAVIIVASGGTWSATVPAVPSGALITATALASGKSASATSDACQASIAGQVLCATSAPPAIYCASSRNIGGAAPTDALVYLRFLDGTLVPANNVTIGSGPNVQTSPISNPPTDPSSKVEFNPVRALVANKIPNGFTAAAGNSWYQFTSQGGTMGSCTSGQAGAFTGVYEVSVVASGGTCESAGTQTCVGSGTTAAPTNTTAPLTTTTTTVTGSTAVSGATVVLYVDGSAFSQVTAVGTLFTFTGVRLPALTLGRVLTFRVNTATTCQSAAVTRTVVNNRAVVPPVVSGPIYPGATTVTGTSVEAPGSVITVTVFTGLNATGTATTLVITTTVQADGSWSLTVPALASNNSVRATVTPVDYGTSGPSNVVNVVPRTTFVPTITGTYTEGNTSVTGTVPANTPVGTVLTVYLDGTPLTAADGVTPLTVTTITTSAGGPTAWTLSGLSSTSHPALYAGGVLTATATAPNQAESAFSNQVPVGCVAFQNRALNTTAICIGNKATVTVANVEPGMIYTLQDVGSGANLASSKLGTGTGTGSLSFTTSTIYNTVGTYALRFNAFSLGAIECSATTGTVNLTVNPLPLARTVSAQNSDLTTYQAGRTGTDITVQNSETGVSYRLVNTSVSPNTPVGPPKNGTGSTLSLPTGGLDTSRNGSTSFTVIGTSVPGCTQTVGTQAITYGGPLPVELVAFEVKAVLTNAALTWRTASEKNNDHFDVERSFDGTDFVKVVQVQGKGDKTSSTDYNLIDTGVGVRAKGAVYYRLKQVDTDSTATYSPVRAVTFTAPRKRQISVYPLPATAATGATLDLTTLPNGSYQVQLVDLMGRILATYRLAGTQLHRLDVQALPASTYMVRVTGQDVQLNARFVKE